MYYLAQFGTVWYYLVLSVALVLLHSVHPWQTSLSSASNVTEDFTPGSPVHQLDIALHICEWLEFKISDNSLPVVFFFLGLPVVWIIKILNRLPPAQPCEQFEHVEPV